MLVGPILSRELLTTPRRSLHYVLRAAYVAIFFVLMWTAWQAIIGFQQVQQIGDVASFNGILFSLLSHTQLTLVLFGASLYGASSIAHEKDRRTFILLLITRLRDSEIVLDKFLCGLLHVGTVYLAALPVFMITGLLGGVGFDQMAQVYAITLGALLVSGATGVLVAVWRDKTFQAVALTMLAVVLSVLLIEIVAALGSGKFVAGVPLSLWCDCLSPYRAIASVIGSESSLTETVPWFGRASWAYLAASVAFAAAYITVAIVKLRVWNPRGEPIQQPDSVEGAETPEGAGAKKRSISKVRTVGANPILWREIATRAYGTRPILIKTGYFLIFGVAAAALFWDPPASSDPSTHLLVARWIGLLEIISLLLINAQAVSAVTSERDLNSIDLLLATDVTPKEFIYGKLFGIAHNAREMILAPLALLLICGFQGLISPLGAVYSALTFCVFVVFVSVLGIHAALRHGSTQKALANSLGTVFLLFVGILICLFLILWSGRFEAQWSSFILFIVIGSIGLWVSLSANAPSNAIGLTAAIAPFATFYCVIAFRVGDRTAPFLVGSGTYLFAVMALLVPLVSEFDIATGRTTAEEG